MVNPKKKTNALVLYSNPGRAPSFCYEPGVTRKQKSATNDNN